MCGYVREVRCGQQQARLQAKEARSVLCAVAVGGDGAQQVGL
jgi:hypothetical protein